MANESLNLTLFKQHCNIDTTDDDDILMLYLDAAESTMLSRINRTFESYLPNDIVLACYMLAAHWYRNREAVSGFEQKPVPYTVEALIAPYISYK